MSDRTVYGYIRVSTDTQSEKGYGLDTQRAAIEKHCRDNDLELLRIFEEKGVSGAAFDEDDEPLHKRHVLLDMLAHLNGVNTVVVLNTSRLWRNDTAKVCVIREIKKAKGDIISIEQPRYSLYSNDPQEKFFNAIMEALDELERGSIALKLAKGRATKARKGDKPAGVTPYGYRYTADKKGIEVNEQEAASVKRMFTMAQTGKTIQQIVDAFNADGITTRQGKAWTKATVHGMLRNPFYTGVLRHQQTNIAGNHTAIISKVQFGKAQKQLERRHK